MTNKESKIARRVMVFGTFDVLHPGHVFFLREAKKLGRELFAIVARDSAVSPEKRKYVWYKELTRMRHVRALRIADRVLLGDEASRISHDFPMIQKWKPNMVAVGYDQTHLISDLRKQSKQWPWKIRIARIKAFRPRQYKSSLLKKKMLSQS